MHSSLKLQLGIFRTSSTIEGHGIGTLGNIQAASLFLFIPKVYLLFNLLIIATFICNYLALLPFLSSDTRYPGLLKNKRDGKSVPCSPCQHEWDLVANAERALAWLLEDQHFINDNTAPLPLS